MRNRVLFLLSLLSLALPALAAAQDVSYFIFGRVFGVHEPVGNVESETTSAIPGVVIEESEPEDPPAAPVPLPGVTIEAYEHNSLLGKGRANRDGFYNLTYNHPEGNHEVRFQVFLDFADGTRELVGEVRETSSGDPIVVNKRLFGFKLDVPTGSAIKAGTPAFAAGSQFLFVEVGDVDQDEISGGLTTAASAFGAGFAFGGTLELYGLFGKDSGVHYYRIDYSGPESGSIADSLDKKNYVLAGSSLETYRPNLGPKNVPVGPAPGLTGVYELDERLPGKEMLPEHPGKFYSSFWTENALRAKWNTAGLEDGLYTLVIKAWKENGDEVEITNPSATLQLHIVNTGPEATIHSIQYLNGNVVLDDAAPCKTILLNKLSSPTFDDNLQFLITANHPDPAFFRDYSLDAWFGHNTGLGNLSASSIPVTNTVVETPPGITYHSCAYRFRLRVVPKITDGYHNLYIREDNWLAAIAVHE